MSIPWTAGEVLEEHMRQIPPEIIESGDSNAIKSALQNNRAQALRAWLGYTCGDIPPSHRHPPRFAGDEGTKCLKLDEYQFWNQAEKDGEQARFDELDAAYEAAKTFYGVN